MDPPGSRYGSSELRMKRAILAVLAAIAIVTPPVHAQSLDIDAPAWGPRLKVTPFLGYAPIVSRTEHWLFVDNGASARDIYHVTLGAGLAAGGSVEMQVLERFAVAGSATWISRGDTEERSEATDARFRHQGSNFLMAKVGIAVRLREQVSDLQVHSMTGTVFFGPAYVREMPKPDPNVPSPVFLDPFSYTGLNFGLDIVLPVVRDRITFTAGIEDYYFHWDDAEFSRRNDIAAGGTARSTVESSASHNVLARAGFSFRIR